MEYIKQELKELRGIARGEDGGHVGIQRSYSEVTKEKKKENVIVIKPKMQQGSGITKNLIKEKIDIKSIVVLFVKYKILWS